jgi:hypothetical protein
MNLPGFTMKEIERANQTFEIRHPVYCPDIINRL